MQLPHTIGLLIALPADRHLLADFLREKGYTVLTPSPKGIQFEDWAMVSLIIIDDSMASVYGQRLLAFRANQQPAYLPVLVALAANADSTPWLQAGFDDVLYLPVAKAELFARLSVFLKLRDQLDERARRSDERFKVMVENAPEGITLLGANGSVQYLSPSTARILGYAPDEIIDPMSLVYPDDVPMVVTLLTRLVAVPGASELAIYRVRHADGSWHWVENIITNLLNDPSVGAFLFNYRDISDRRQAEDALRIREEHAVAFQDRLKRLHEVSVELAQAGTSDALYREAVGLGRERLGFDRLGLFLVQEGSQRVVGTYGTDPAGQTRNESETTFILDHDSLILQSVDHRWNVILSPDKELWDDGQVIGRGWNAMAMLGNRHDPIGWLAADNLIRKEPLHEEQIELLSLYASMLGALILKMRSETRLRKSEASLSAAQHLAHMGSWELDLIDLSNIINNPIRWSDEVFRIFGYEQATTEITAAHLVNAIVPDDQESVTTSLLQTLDGSADYKIDYRITRQDGVERIIHARADVVYDPQTGKPFRLTGTVQDVTEQKQAEALLFAKNEEIRGMTEQLWQAAKLATLGELAASLAHELNNPLATVNLRVEALLGQTPAEAPGRRSLEIVEQEVERMARLVSNLLQFSRRSVRSVSTQNICEEISNTLELIQFQLRSRQIEVVEECEPDISMIPADRQQLRQLFLNLIANASDAMLDGGVLTVRAKNAGVHIQIEISDTGTGIAPQNMSKIMEPFFTTKPEGKGTGLGLAICRRIIQEHGGRLEVVSSGLVGEGTTVTVLLPIQYSANHLHLGDKE